MSESEVPPGGRRDEFEALLDSVAHDLRSPLLTMALGIELLGDGSPGDGDAGEREQLAQSALREGIRDLERMLDAVATLARATKRTLAARSALAGVLPAELLPPDALERDIDIDADARLVAEFVAALDHLDAAGAGPELALCLDDAAVELSAPLPATVGLEVSSPLAALLDSLTLHAGGVVEQLAAIELQAVRQGGSLVVADGRAALRLPRAAGAGS